MTGPQAPPAGGALPAGDGAIGRLRVLSRLTGAFLLDTVQIARGASDPLDTLLASAIIQANVADIQRHADVLVAFAESDAPPPDSLRRPVSINAVAASLNLPFETVRRRIGAMARDGFVRFVDGGVIVPAQALSEPRYAVDAYRGYERLRAFYYDLSDLGLLGELPPPTVELAPGVVPVRAVARLVGAYVLRVAEAIARIGDLWDGLILFEVFRSNTEHWSADVRGQEGTAAADMPPDAMRRPVSVGFVARRLGMSPETVRRHVLGMIDRGFIVRTAGGLIVPAEALARPAVFPSLAVSAANLHRLMAALSQLGVLAVWDSVRETCPPAVDAAAAG